MPQGGSQKLKVKSQKALILGFLAAHCTSSATQNSKSLIYKLFTDFVRCLIVERWLAYLHCNTVLAIVVQKSQNGL